MIKATLYWHAVSEYFLRDMVPSTLCCGLSIQSKGLSRQASSHYSIGRLPLPSGGPIDTLFGFCSRPLFNLHLFRELRRIHYFPGRSKHNAVQVRYTIYSYLPNGTLGYPTFPALNSCSRQTVRKLHATVRKRTLDVSQPHSKRLVPLCRVCYINRGMFVSAAKHRMITSHQANRQTNNASYQLRLVAL